MRHTLQALAALLLASLFAAPVAAVTPGGASQVTITGVVEAAQVELGDAGDHYEYTIRSGNEITRFRDIFYCDLNGSRNIRTSSCCRNGICDGISTRG